MNAKRIILVLACLFVASALFANGGTEQPGYDVVFSSSLLDLAPEKVLRIEPTQEILDIFLEEEISEECLSASPQGTATSMLQKSRAG